MKTIHINVVDKVATARQRDGVIVCGNGDYQVQFTFDAEWSADTPKTARFLWNGQYVDVPFTGDVCQVPVVSNTLAVSVGVYTEELSTTTPATIECKKSILCLGGEASAEARKEYADRAEAAAERAEEAADRAEDFEGKCIKDITTTSAEGINEVKVILNDDTVKTFNVKDGEKGEAGTTPHVGENGNWWIGDTDTGISVAPAIVQTVGDSENKVMSQKATTDAIKKVDEEFKKALNYKESRNLYNNQFNGTENVDGLTITYTNGYAIGYEIDLSSGKILASEGKYMTYLIPIEGGKTLYFQATATQTPASPGYIFFYDAEGGFISWLTGASITAPANARFIRIYNSSGTWMNNPSAMLNYDGESLEYTPYEQGYDIVDGTARAMAEEAKATASEASAKAANAETKATEAKTLATEAKELAEEAKNSGDGSISSYLTAKGEEARSTEKETTLDEEYNKYKVADLDQRIARLWEYIGNLHTPTVLDEGVCGPSLTWKLYSDGLLKISGTGRAYDYCKGLFGDKVTRAYIEDYQAQYEGLTDLESKNKYARGFQEGKTYDDEHGQYIAPWYKYRPERHFLDDIPESEGGYSTRATYAEDNPNGWEYNRIEIDEGITYLGNWMFYRVCGVTELVIPETVTEIGDWSIRYSPSLKCVHLPSGLTEVGEYGVSRLEEALVIRLTGTLESVGDFAFSTNLKVTDFVLKVSNDAEPGTYLFSENKSLKRIVLDGMSIVPDRIFNNCPKLETVELSDALTKLPATFVTSCEKIKSIKIPANVTEAGVSAFEACDNLMTVYIDSPTVAAGLINANSFGHLIHYAKYVYIKDGISTLGSCVNVLFTKCADIDGYTLYIRK